MRAPLLGLPKFISYISQELLIYLMIGPDVSFPFVIQTFFLK